LISPTIKKLCELVFLQKYLAIHWVEFVLIVKVIEQSWPDSVKVNPSAIWEHDVQSASGRKHPWKISLATDTNVRIVDFKYCFVDFHLSHQRCRMALNVRHCNDIEV